MADDDSERGRPATFDPKSGEVRGSGSGAGGGGNPRRGLRPGPDGRLRRRAAARPAEGGRGGERPIDPDEGI